MLDQLLDYKELLHHYPKIHDEYSVVPDGDNKKDYDILGST